MDGFWLCFVPLFVAVDAVGVLPLFLGLVDGMAAPRLRSVIAQSLVTAAVVALVFLAAGPAILRFLGITVPDFMIAGGALLFALSLADLLSGEKKPREIDAETLGAVPLGVPLITGPAVLTTCLLLATQHGLWVTGAALLVNIALAGLVFSFAQPITRWLGHAGTKTVSKIASLLLAAIGVMLLRRGILEIAGLAARP